MNLNPGLSGSPHPPCSLHCSHQRFYIISLLPPFFLCHVLLYCLWCRLKILILFSCLIQNPYWLFSWKNFKQLRNLFFIHSGCIFEREINRKWSCNSFHLTASQRWMINVNRLRPCKRSVCTYSSKLWKLSRFLHIA